MPAPLITLIRTGVAALVGALVTWAATHGIALDQETTEAAQLLLFAAVAGAYNAAVNAAAKRWPVLGWLLGHPATPSYTSVKS